MRLSECKPGVPVYYHAPEGDTCPGEVVRAARKRVLIQCNGPERPMGEYWVSPSRLEPQAADPCIEARVWIDGYGLTASINGRRVVCGSFRGTYGAPVVEQMEESCRQALAECLDDFRRRR